LIVRRALRPALLTLLPLFAAGCATTNTRPAFKYVSLSLHGANQGQGAARSIDHAGKVEGSHMSHGRSNPVISMSSEQARPEHMAEIADLVARLPPAPPAPADAAATSHSELSVIFADGQSVRYYLPDGQRFTEPELQRLQEILRSYRAGYW
jgi:hypothetical protein